MTPLIHRLGTCQRANSELRVCRLSQVDDRLRWYRYRLSFVFQVRLHARRSPSQPALASSDNGTLTTTSDLDGQSEDCT
jgi:hypothetical protein